MKLRVIAVVLVLCVIAGGFPLTVTSSQASSVVEQITVNSPEKLYGSGRIENPLYPDATYPAVARTASATTLSVADTTFYKSIEEAAAALRAGLVARQSEITIGYTHQGSWGTDLFVDIWFAALTHTGVPTEGDYLRWQWSICDLSYTYSSTDDTVYDFVIVYCPVYYTTAEQEAEVNDAVDALLDELDLWAMSDYKKICGIYDWICANVTYDYEHLEDLSYSPMFTAYAALVDGTAVCQGYANLFYRLALELGVDARIIAGIGGGGSHSWNIVKLGEAYYNADATWDASLRQAGLDYQYFLCSDSDFVDHTRSDEYLTLDFIYSYPVDETSYDPSCSNHRYQSVVTAATCEKYGYTTHTCSNCGSRYVDDFTDALGHSVVDGVCVRCSLALMGSGVCGDDLTWRLTEDGVLTIDGTGAMWDFSSVDQQPWNSLSEDITHVILGPEVTSVGDMAFRDCSNLQTVEFGDALEWIGAWAFQHCTSLQNIELPDSLAGIGQEAFADCDSLTAVIFPANLFIMYPFAFARCDSLSYVKFECNPYLFFMGNGCFEYCPSLEAFVVEEGHIALRTYDDVLFFEDRLMQYPSGKKDAAWAIPEGTVCIIDNAFGGAVYLEHISFPTSVTEILSFAFRTCENLKEIELNEGLKLIDAGAFYECTAVTSIVIPGSVTEIIDCAFAGCKSLSYVKFKSDPELESFTLDGKAFSNCPSLESFVVEDGHIADLNVIDGVLFSGSSLLRYPTGKKDTVWTIPEGTTSVEPRAFASCTNLTNIVIPESVTKISRSAFELCENLKAIELSEGLELIDSNAFYGCFALESIVIPSSVTKIGDNAFCVCIRLKEITFTGDAPLIEQEAFALIESNVYYPVNNATWTEDVMQDYGGTITWLPICQEHDYKAVVTDPTCTEVGYTTYTCSACGDSYTGDEVPAAGHSYGDWVQTKAPSCTEKSEETRTCSCGASETREVDATGHNYEAAVTDPTCTEAGYTTYTCSACGDSYTGDEVPSIGHSFGDWYVVNEPTATSAGEERRSCTNCDHYETREIPATGHDDAAADFTDDGIIDNKDVEYLLWYTLFPESYPVEVDADFNDDGIVDNKDVEYLLWHTLFPDSFPL